MKVENVGKNTSDGAIDKKKWVILFSAFGVVIVGLVIAIVVVLATRGGGGSEIVDDSLQDEAINSKFYEIMDRISEEIDNSGYGSEKVLNLFREEIDAAEDEKLKAKLGIEYYMMLAFVSNDNVKNEVIDGLENSDMILKTATSALSVAYVANLYGDEDLENKYNEIADRRLELELQEEANLPETVEEDDEEEETE